MSGRRGGQRLSDMLNVKCALFQVMVAKYFSCCIPVIREKGGEERGVLRGFGLYIFTTDSNKLRALETAFLRVVRVVHVPPSPSEIRARLQG
ncbi:hypothetical protein PBY51_006082 [Eleginops maclovinus]|uniref:Uncharacterized protein n=1 Tax=Eleginops maclovinus TaxID=56733 RepID=A0AAN7ZVF1_ELEMC|nr:hypothetical protein PBY51_006082 [Eleginops maclovinus]